MSMMEIFETAADQVLQELQNPQFGWEMISASKLGLDERCGLVYINRQTKEGIIVNGINDKNLQYYGGFEYINKCDRWVIGNHIFYTYDNNRRVQECYNWLNN